MGAWKPAILLLTCAVSARAQGAADVAQVQGDVRRVVMAVYEGDVETVLRFTHPPILDMMGGREQAKAVLQSVTREFQALGMTPESFSFPEPPQFLQGVNRQFALVPTRAIVVTRGKRIESWNFQLGIRDDNSAQWTYFEGSRLTDAIRERFFPDLPHGYKRPRVSRRVL